MVSITKSFLHLIILLEVLQFLFQRHFICHLQPTFRLKPSPLILQQTSPSAPEPTSLHATHHVRIADIKEPRDPPKEILGDIYRGCATTTSIFRPQLRASRFHVSCTLHTILQVCTILRSSTRCRPHARRRKPINVLNERKPRGRHTTGGRPGAVKSARTFNQGGLDAWTKVSHRTCTGQGGFGIVGTEITG